MMEPLIFDSYSVLTTEIATELSEENIKIIKFIIRRDIGRGILEKVVTGRDMVRLFEDKYWLSPEKVDFLSNLLQTCGRNDLHNKVQQYIISAVFRNLSNHDYYGLQGMHVREDCMETSEYRKLCDHMESNNIVILKGIPGTWKSQYAFMYAHTFAKNHDQETKPLIWRVDCNSELNMYNSLSHLMNYLKIQCVNSENLMEASILQMLSRATEFLQKQKYACVNHLFILVGFVSAQIGLMERVLKHLKLCKRISVIATTSKWLPGDLEANVIEIQGLTEEEAVRYLAITDDSTKNFGKQLAKKLSYLPDGLVFAKAYMTNTKTSINSYLEKLELLRSGEKDSAAEACLILIRQAEMIMTNEERKLLQFLPYMNTQNIPIFIIKALLPDSLGEDGKDVLINRFLLTLRNHSLISIKGEDDTRIISAHTFTFMTLKASKTTEERKSHEQTLLDFYMSYFDLDARLLEVIYRNALLLDHAETLLKNLDESTEDYDTIATKCYLFCAIGITYRLYGNTELSAELFFKRAKKVIYTKFVRCSELVAEEGSPPTILNEYLDGHESIGVHAQRIFTALIDMGRKLSPKFIDNFLENKLRTKRDISLLCNDEDIDINFVSTGKLPGHVVDYLVDQNLIMNSEHTSESFLVELMIRIVYNSSKNTWLKELSKDNILKESSKDNILKESSKDNILSSSNQHETEGKHFRNQVSSTYLPVTQESLVEQQLAHRLTHLLQTYMEDIKISPKTNGIRTFCPVFSSVTKRSAVLYMLRSVDDETIMPELLREAITLLEKLDIDIEGIGFVEFGVVKRIGDSSLFHAMMIDRILMECYERLSKLEGQNDNCHLKKAIAIAEKIEKRISELTAWKALSGIHLKIAKVLRLSGTPKNIQKAKDHYKKAYEREYESNNVRLTRFHLKAVVNYAECCLQYPRKEELEIAKTLSVDMKSRFQLKETDAMFDGLITDIENKIEEISATRKLTREPSSTTLAIQTEQKMTQTENEYVALRISNLETRKGGLETELKMVTKELDELKSIPLKCDITRYKDVSS